ncbi:putative ribonuclease H-like domain-containing protein [Tanacetum coccineum]
MPTFAQTSFSQPAVHTQQTQTNPTGQQYPNNVQTQQFQQFQTATVSANNAKFPYLEKEKYEIWAMKMEYWIQNADHNLWRIVQQGNSPKRLGKDAKGNTIVHPPVSLDEHVAVQRENKVRTLGIWMAVKARQASNDDINLKVSKSPSFPSSWSHVALTLKNKRWPESMFAAAPTHSAFHWNCCSGSKLLFSDQQHHAAEKTRTNELQKVLWMMAGHDADNMVMIFLYAADEFAMWEFLPKAQKEKEEWEVKFEATLARFEKWKESSKNLKKLIDSSMSTRTKIGLGFQAYFGVDEVFDLSTYLECILLRPTQRHHASCDSSLKTQTKDIPPADDIMTLPKSDIEDPNSTTGSPNCDFYNCVDSVPCNSKAASVSAGSRKSPASDQQSILLGRRISPASVPAGRSDSAASRKQPAVHSVVLHIYMVGLMPANFDSGAQEVEQEKRKACCFVPNQGWHCNFCSGDGRISGKGTIRTFKADFENVYYVESCSTLTYFLCGTKKSRKHDLYTFHISDLQPEQKHMGLLVLPISGIDQKYYSLVVTDDFSRFSWTFFLGTKDETFYVLKEFIALIENQLNKKGIKRDIAILEPHNKMGLLREKNRTLIEAARTMLADSKLPTMFWTEAVSTACYVLNRVSITNPHNKTPYELISGKIMQLFILETGLVLWERNADYAEELARLQIKNMKLGRCLPIWIMLGCSAVKDSAGIDSVVRAPDGIVFADGVSTGSPSADSDPADGHPADSFTPAGSVEPADKSNPAVSSSVSVDLNSCIC